MAENILFMFAFIMKITISDTYMVALPYMFTDYMLIEWFCLYEVETEFQGEIKTLQSYFNILFLITDRNIWRMRKVTPI